MHISKFWIQVVLGGALGTALVLNGLTVLTPGFWIVVVIAFLMRIVGDE